MVEDVIDKGEEFKEEVFRKHIMEELKEKKEHFVDGMHDAGAFIQEEYREKRQHIEDELKERGEQLKERSEQLKQSFKEKEGKCMYYIGEICLLLLVELIAVALMYILIKILIRDLPVP